MLHRLFWPLSEPNLSIRLDYGAWTSMPLLPLQDVLLFSSVRSSPAPSKNLLRHERFSVDKSWSVICGSWRERDCYTNSMQLLVWTISRTPASEIYCSIDMHLRWRCDGVAVVLVISDCHLQFVLEFESAGSKSIVGDELIIMIEHEVECWYVDRKK